MPKNSSIINSKLSFHIFNDGFFLNSNSEKSYFLYEDINFLDQKELVQFLKFNEIDNHSEPKIIFFDSPSMFIPSKLHDYKNSKQLLSNYTGLKPNYRVVFDITKDEQICVVYQLNNKIEKSLNECFKKIERKHYSTILYDRIKEYIKSDTDGKLKLFVNLQKNKFDLFLIENSKSYISYNNKQLDSSTVYISSFDQMNFNCCKKHRVYISNPKKIKKGVFAVSQGDFAIGKTRILSNNEIEVRLLSDPEEYISIKTTKEFFCIAKGDGEALTISCLNESKAVSYEIGDTFFTTGFDGIYPAGLIVGRLKNIESIENNLFRQKLDIELFFDPFKSINKRAILHE